MYRSTALRAVIPLLLTLTVLLSACHKNNAAPVQHEVVPEVGVVTLRAQPYTEIIELPGRTSAYRIAEVRPQVDGIVQQRLFTEGSDVAAGQQLYQIDPAVYESALRSAEAAQTSSRLLRERYQALSKQQAVSKQTYDEARAAAEQAEASLERARIDLRYTRVLAPLSGRIGRSMASEGALVSSGQTAAMAVIQQLDPIYVDVTQPARELLAWRREPGASGLAQDNGNAQVTLTLEDGRPYSHIGTLEFSEAMVDADTGSVTLRAVFPNPDRLLLPGMFVHAHLATGTRSDAVLVPQQGVTRTPNGDATALVVNADNRVELRKIVTERTVGNHWLVSAGLSPGDRLITEGLQFIRPGSAVSVVPASNVAPLNQIAAVPVTAHQE